MSNVESPNLKLNREIEEIRQNVEISKQQIGLKTLLNGAFAKVIFLGIILQCLQ